MRTRRAISDQRGSAAVEFALLVPMLLVLLFGGIEAGHFVWTQHKLVEAVRDGARFAGRLPIRELCEGSDEVMSDETRDRIRLLTRTGQIASTAIPPKVPNWTQEQVEVEPHCDNTDYVDTGLYAEYAAEYPGSKAPVIVVIADDVAYPWMFNALGSLMSGIAPNVQMSAHSTSAGIGL